MPPRKTRPAWFIASRAINYDQIAKFNVYNSQVGGFERRSVVGSAKKMRHFSSRPISSTGSFLGVMSQLRNGICPPDLFKFMRGHRSILFSNSCITAFDEIFPARACVIDIYRKIESCLVPTSLFHHPFVVTMLHNTFSNWEIGFFCGKNWRVARWRAPLARGSCSAREPTTLCCEFAAKYSNLLVPLGRVVTVA